MIDKQIEMLTNVVGHGPEMSDNQIEMLMLVVEHGVNPEVAWKIINVMPAIAAVKLLVRDAS